MPNYKNLDHRILHETFCALVPKRATSRTWVEDERRVMHATVNAMREVQGKAPVGVEEIIRAENRAMGATYDTKFSMYCADLVAAA